MNPITGMSFLVLAAVLEAGGDAVMRVAIHNQSRLVRVLLFFVAAAVLAAYGWTVNATAWDFGKLIGLYVVVFFIVGQIISWLVFKQQPSLSSFVAGMMILGGGIVFTLGNR